MKKIWLWPGIVVAILIFLKIYDLIHPCVSGMCGMGELLILIFASVILLVYGLEILIYRVVTKTKLANMDRRTLIIFILISILGLMSVLFFRPMLLQLFIDFYSWLYEIIKSF